jgi:hypothetical protein
MAASIHETQNWQEVISILGGTTVKLVPKLASKIYLQARV